MKLELKHLSGYLPYDTVVFVNDCENKKIKPIHKLNAYVGIGNINHILTSSRYQVVLRPLSDLANEIEANGEKFVPIEFFEIGDDNNKSIEFDYGNIKLINRLNEVSKFNVFQEMNYLPYFVVQKLLEWHFDIYGLIESGLAIDINTLK